MSTPCLLTPHGHSSSTCGYCTPSGSRRAGLTSKKYGLEASQMSPQFYQDMIDRGWRRSGDYVYHPNMARTCCPQYTIRLEALEYKPNKKHRQVINRFNRYLLTGEKPGDPEASTSGASVNNGKNKTNGKGKGKKGKDTGIWIDSLRAQQLGYGGGTSTHKFETVLVPAKATTENFELYKKYQVAVHNDKPGQVSMRGFSRFLCDSPVADQPIPYTKEHAGLPETYGSYHLLYKVDNELIGISVIDILPSCVSSVYFIWHPDWAWASLGKLSAMHEIALGVEINKAGVESMKYLYMGYWISNCVKMRYKSEYSPSYLLDPGTNQFHPLTPTLDKYLQANSTGYHPFALIPSDWKPPLAPDVESAFSFEEDYAGKKDEEAEDDDVEELDENPTTPPPGFADPTSYSEDQIDKLLVLMRGGPGKRTRLVPLGALQFVEPEAVLNGVREMVAAVGLDLMADGSALGKMKDKGILFFG